MGALETKFSELLGIALPIRSDLHTDSEEHLVADQALDVAAVPALALFAIAYFVIGRSLQYFSLLVRAKLMPDEQSLILRYELLSYAAMSKLRRARDVVPLVKCPVEMFDRVMAINVRGVFLGLKHVLPAMIARGRGAVVNTASLGAYIGTRNLGPYTASKHGLLGLTKVLALEAAAQSAPINFYAWSAAVDLVKSHLTAFESSTKLKVTGIDLFSAGDFMGGPDCEEIVMSDPAGGVYKKLVLKGDRLIGACLYGDTVDGSWYFKLLREGRSVADIRDKLMFGESNIGDVGHQGQSKAAAMQDADEVCGCNGVTKGAICKAIKDKGLFTLDEVRKHTKASASCGSCTGLVEQILMFTAGGDYSATPKMKPMCGCRRSTTCTTRWRWHGWSSAA